MALTKNVERIVAVSDSFREYAIEQFRRARLAVRAKKMFGGVGLYSDNHFFAVIDNDTLYLKTDAEFEKDFVELGMKPFQPFGDDAAPMHYHEIPPDVLEDPESLRSWANRAIDIARKKKHSKASKRDR